MIAVDAVEVAKVVGMVVAALFACWRMGVWRFIRAAANGPFIIEAVAKEFSPNGGSSLRDAVDRLEKFAVYQHQRNDDVLDQVLAIRGRLAYIESELFGSVDPLGKRTEV